MKKWITAFSIVLAFACNNQDAGEVVIKGSVNGNPEKQSVYLDVVDLVGDTHSTLSTIDIDPGNPSFKLKGGIPSEGEAIYRVRFGMDNRFIFLVNDRNDLSFQVDWNHFPGYTSNSGSSNSFRNVLNEFNDRLKRIDSLRNAVVAVKSRGNADSLLKITDSSFRAYVTSTEEYLLHYADTTKSPSIALYIVGPLLRKQLDADRFAPVMTSMAKRFPDHPVVTKVVSNYFDYMRRQEAGNLIGKPAPDFSLPDPDGKLIPLSSFRGKYLLVDFWASWCGPCRQENPNVVAAYNQFKDKNFTILGVSLDRSKDPWVKAIKDDRLSWTHVSDLKYWESAVVPLYGIEGIPYNVLLDPQGKVVAMNLRGPALQQKLSELLH